MSELIAKITGIISDLEKQKEDNAQRISSVTSRINFLKDAIQNTKELDVNAFKSLMNELGVNTESGRFSQLLFILESKLFIDDAERSQIKDLMKFFNEVCNEQILQLETSISENKEFDGNYDVVINNYKKMLSILENQSTETYVDATMLAELRKLSESIKNEKEFISFLVKVAKNNISIDAKQKGNIQTPEKKEEAPAPRTKRPYRRKNSVTQNPIIVEPQKDIITTPEAQEIMPAPTQTIEPMAEVIPMMPLNIVEEAAKQKSNIPEEEKYKNLIDDLVNELNDSLTILDRMKTKNGISYSMYLTYKEVISRINDLKEEYYGDLEMYEELINNGAFKNDKILDHDEGESYNIVIIGLLFNDAIKSNNYELLNKKLTKFLYYEFLYNRLDLNEYLLRSELEVDSFDLNTFLEENDSYIDPVEPVSPKIRDIFGYSLQENRESIDAYLKQENIPFTTYLAGMIGIIYDELHIYLETDSIDKLNVDDIYNYLYRLKSYSDLLKNMKDADSMASVAPKATEVTETIPVADKLYPENNEFNQYLVFLDKDHFLEQLRQMSVEEKNLLEPTLLKLKKLVVADENYFTNGETCVFLMSNGKYKTKNTKKNKNSFRLLEFRRGKVRVIFKRVEPINGKGIVIVSSIYKGQQSTKENGPLDALNFWASKLVDYKKILGYDNAKTALEQIIQKASAGDKESYRQLMDYISEAEKVYSDLYKELQQTGGAR